MTKYLLRRLLNYLILLFVAVTIAYFLAGTQLDPRSLLIENELTKMANTTYLEVVHTVDARLNAWNINPQEPIVERYVDWLGMIANWDWGSYCFIQFRPFIFLKREKIFYIVL